MKTKNELRKQIRLLKQQYKDDLQSMSIPVLTALEGHPAFKEAHTVLLYYSLPDEVHTHAFVEKWKSAKRILLPVVVGNELELRTYTGKDSLQTGAYGIEEPTGTRYTDYAHIDFVAVPGVAFDRKGNRLGRGKGYYDRLLPLLTQAYKAGICFPFQLTEEIPTDFYDIRMDTIITSDENKLSHPHHPLPACDRE